MAYYGDTCLKLLVTFCIAISLLSHNGIIFANAAKKFSSILIFGDSLVDTGNNNYVMTMVRANNPPYGKSMPNQEATGRFSDGRLMGDLLAEALGIKNLVPPYLQPNLTPEDLTTGVCFASAGSGYDDLTVQTSKAIPVSTQLNYFNQYVEKLNAAGGGAEQILANAFVFCVAGSNDYMLNYYLRPQRKALGPSGFANLLHQQIIGMIKTLYAAGVRNLLVAGIPPFPEAAAYNQALKEQVLPVLQQELQGSKIVYADLATPMSELQVTGAKYGITVTMGSCCRGMPCMSGGMACPDPKQYLKFDAVHYTEAAYTVMAKYLLSTAIPQFG